MRANLLLARAIVGGVVTAQLSGALLLALAVAVESAGVSAPALLATLRGQVPGAWAQAAGVLGGAGVAAATLRLRRRGVILALGTLGVDPRRVVLAGALVAAVAGAAVGALAVAPEPEPGAWIRGEGGWVRDGVGWPDIPGVVVTERALPSRSVPVDAVNAGLIGACGAALGLWAGATPALLLSAVLLIVDVVGRGLAERGAAPGVAVLTPAVVAGFAVAILLVRAPLFPRRWG